MGHKERKHGVGDGELCRRPSARRKFLKNRGGEFGIQPHGATRGVINEMFSTATKEDIEIREAEQVARFLEHLSRGTLTPEWRKFGRKHVPEIIVFQRRTEVTGLRNR